MKTELTLVVLAAGMGSRYGGLKQLDPMGPHGETVLDYSVYDALRSGFTRIVFVIRRDIEKPFREVIGKRYADMTSIDYAFQELEDLPGTFSCPDGRRKPWGTGHAVLAARNQVNGPFSVINADDFYGRDAFQVMSQTLSPDREDRPLLLHMVGYRLQNTLSENGPVNRGICQVAANSLEAVKEVTGISRDAEGNLSGTDTSGNKVKLEANALVSMNFWGFPKEIFQPLEEHFSAFLSTSRDTANAEFYIPSFVSSLISEGKAVCEVLPTKARWFGVTYPEDKPQVQQSLNQLIAEGCYPSPLLQKP